MDDPHVAFEAMRGRAAAAYQPEVDFLRRGDLDATVEHGGGNNWNISVPLGQDAHPAMLSRPWGSLTEHRDVDDEDFSEAVADHGGEWLVSHDEYGDTAELAPNIAGASSIISGWARNLGPQFRRD